VNSRNPGIHLKISPIIGLDNEVQPCALEDCNMAGEMATWGPQSSEDESVPSP